MRLHRLVFSAAIAGASVFCFTVSGLAETTADQLGQQVHKVFEQCKGAVVRIQATDSHGQLYGTGFFIDPNGTLYTSYSVGGGTHDIIVFQNDQKYPAKRLVADSESGVAILKIDTQTPFLPIGKSSALSMGSPLMTIGYAMNMPLAPSFGIMQGLDMRYLGNYFRSAHIRATVPVDRGQGGAPLLNMQGEVVGILISSIDNGACSFSLPIEAAEKVHKDYLRFGEVKPGWIGVKVVASDNLAEGSNVAISEVVENSPAEKAGLKKNDMLLKIGSRKIQTPPDVLNAGFYLTAGDTVQITLMRAGKKMTVSVKAGTRPELTDQANLPSLQVSKDEETPFK